MRNWVVGLLITATALCLAIAGIQTYRFQKASLAAWTADTTARNERARHDSTRRVVVTLGDSIVAVFDRLAEQTDVSTRLRRDNILLRNERGAALAQLELLGDSLERMHLAVAVEEDSGTFRTADSLDARDSTGIFVKAQVALTLEPLQAQWQWNLVRDPLNLNVAFICQGRDAAVRVTGPSWADLNVAQAAQDPMFCNPLPKPWNPFSIKPPSVPWALALFIGGFLLGGK